MQIHSTDDYIRSINRDWKSSVEKIIYYIRKTYPGSVEMLHKEKNKIYPIVKLSGEQKKLGIECQDYLKLYMPMETHDRQVLEKEFIYDGKSIQFLDVNHLPLSWIMDLINDYFNDEKLSKK